MIKMNELAKVNIVENTVKLHASEVEYGFVDVIIHNKEKSVELKVHQVRDIRDYEINNGMFSRYIDYRLQNTSIHIDIEYNIIYIFGNKIDKKELTKDWWYDRYDDFIVLYDKYNINTTTQYYLNSREDIPYFDDSNYIFAVNTLEPVTIKRIFKKNIDVLVGELIWVTKSEYCLILKDYSLSVEGVK